MSLFTTRTLSVPGWPRRLITAKAITFAGSGKFTKIANLTVGEAIGRIALEMAIKRLPPLKPGYVRFTHKTDDLTYTAKNGHRYIGYILFSMFRFETEAAAADYLRTSKTSPGSKIFSYPRKRAIIFDLPLAEAERHCRLREWGPPESFVVPAKYIVGIIDTSQQSHEIRKQNDPSSIMG